MIQIAKYNAAIKRLCRKNKAVSRLYLFGSALTPRFDVNTSDIDILVETKDLSPEEKGEQLILLWNELEALFNRRVDLLTENSLSNPFLKEEIEQTKTLIYDGQSRQILV